MPIEVMAGGHIHYDTPTLVDESQHKPVQRGSMFIRNRKKMAPPPTPVRMNPIRPFAHNYLHDMESIWWIFVWFFFQLPIIPRAQSSVLHSTFELFPREVLLLSSRQNFLLSKDEFYKHISNVQISENQFDPVQELLKSLADALNDARALIVEGYLALEQVAHFPCETPLFSRYCQNVGNALYDARDVADHLSELLRSTKHQQWTKMMAKKRKELKCGTRGEEYSRKKAKRTNEPSTAGAA